MGQQRLNQKKPAAPTRSQSTKTSVKSPVHPVEELQAAIGNREMGRLMETNRLPHPSSPFPKLQGELPLLGGMPVSQGTIQRQPLFRGLSQELNAEKGTLALPETGALVQRKLTLGTPNDMYEQEADRVARQVVDEIHSSPFREQNSLSEGERKPDGGEALRVQRQITVCAAGDAGGELSSEWEGELQGAKSGGQPLSPTVKEPMERAFGADFSGVRVHTGAQADSLARTIQAKAFTKGQDVFFRQGAYESGSRGGQELIAHELTHVVQQNGGAVMRSPLPPQQLQQHLAIETPSVMDGDSALQTKGEVIWNSQESSKEQHPNNIGLPLGRPEKSGFGSHSHFSVDDSLHLTTGIRSTIPLIQRKIKYRNASNINHVTQIEQELMIYAQKEGLPRIQNLGSGLVALRESLIDYGEIDLTDPQHLALLYHYITKQTDEETARNKRPDKAVPIKSQETLVDEADQKWKGKKNLHTGRVFKVAFLGAGASVAYALQTLDPNIDPSDAVIIGLEQPWRETRGPGVVAHPEHMVTPKRQHASETVIDDVFVERGRFSDRIDEAIEKSRIRRLKGAVENINRIQNTKDPLDKYYCIQVPEFYGTFIYAEKVVTGIGVGGHDPRRIVSEEQIARQPRQVGPHRVFDMDLWAHVASRLEKLPNGTVTLGEENADHSNITVILSGGNGGIDVAFDALNRGYKVQWIVGNTGPKFLPGFFNYAAYLAYLRSLRDNQLTKAGVENRKEELDKAKRLIPDLYASQKGENAHPMFQNVVARFLPETTRFEGIYFGRTGNDAVVTDWGVELPAMDDRGSIRGDVLVYAQGQDNKTFKLIEEFVKDLVPKTDIDRRFTDDGTTTLGLQSSDGTLEVIGATAYRLAPQVGVTKKQVDQADKQLSVWRDKAAEICKLYQYQRLRYRPFSKVWNAYIDYAQKFNTSDASTSKALQDFNNEAREYDNYIESIQGVWRTPKEAEVLEGFGAALAFARNQSQGPMTSVIASLPDNVLINDQLTPSRSQIEAASGFVPRDAGRQANFITDDRTALAVHISAKYPAIADKRPKMDELITKIIKSRIEKVEHGPDYQALPPHQVKFQKFWQDQLQMIEDIWKR